MTIFRRNSLLAIMILWSLFAAAPFGGAEARAEQACVIRNEVVEQLGKKFGEAVTARGLSQNGKAMIELLVSDSGSWTVLASDPTGRSCIIATGEDWHHVPVLKGDPA